MSQDANLVKQLRDQTGIGFMECKKALVETGDNLEKAIEYLRKRGFEKAKSKAGRSTNQGSIGAYIHTHGNIGVMVELGCETDFVAKNEDFKTLLKDIAMQIAAMNPKYIAPENVPADVLEKEKEIFAEQMKNSGKPAEIINKIVEGKLAKLYSEICLLNQAFFKDDSVTIDKLIAEKIHKIGENIVVKRFVRYQVGEEF